jgi:hypothetical protein
MVQIRERRILGRRGDAVGEFGVAIVDCSLSSSCRADVPCRYLACIGGVPLLVVESNLQPARVHDEILLVRAKHAG